MEIKRDLQINHYLVTSDSDKSFKTEYFYSPVKGEDARRHREDGPAMVYKSKTEDMTYLEWWDKGALVATFNSQTNHLKKTAHGTFSTLEQVQLPEKWKGLEGSLSLSDIALCNELVAKPVFADDKSQVMSNLSKVRDTFVPTTPSAPSNGVRPT